MKKVNLFGENVYVKHVLNVRMSKAGMYQEVLFNTSISYWNTVCVI